MKLTAFTAPLLMAALLLGCSKPALQNPAAADAADVDADDGSTEVDDAEQDKMCEEDISGDQAAEAKEWLAKPTNRLFEGSKEEVVALTESFYKAGCPKVHVTNIEKLGNNEITASMVVTLPAESDKRQAAFKLENDFWEKQGEFGDKDRGQKYLSLSFD